MLSDLKAKAKKATPGPWEAQEPAMATNFGKAKIKPLKITGKLYNHPMIKQADAEYIAACSPEVIISMCEEIEALKKTITELRIGIDEAVYKLDHL